MSTDQPEGVAPTDDAIRADAGVPERLRRRTAGAATVLAGTGLLIAVTAWSWPGWAESVTGVALAGAAVALCLALGGVLVRRSHLWSLAAVEATRDETGWMAATCGDPAALHAGRGSIPLFRRERRTPAFVLPIRSAEGPLAAGHAVIVHGRPDGVRPRSTDTIRIRVYGPRGPYLIRRADDGLIFAADRWITGIG